MPVPTTSRVVADSHERVHTTFWGFLKEVRFVLSTGTPENGMHPSRKIDLTPYLILRKVAPNNGMHPISGGGSRENHLLCP